MARDPHQALKSEVVARAQGGGANFLLARLQWSKDDIGYSLHVEPSTWSTSGIQIPDFLSYLGFERSGCGFAAGRQCYVRWVDEGFNVEQFASLFGAAYGNLGAAARELESCGFFFVQPEGWGYFFGKQSRGRQLDFSFGGDGHTAAKHESMKQSEDDNFLYRLTWLDTGREKGWVIHYRPKHPPLSAELESVFKFLGLKTFGDCPEFDFEDCYWRSIKFDSRGDGFFDSNANTAHGWFDSHAKSFSAGIEKLLTANAEIEKSGLTFLPFARPSERL